jgi:hypothetical protein
LWIVPDQGHTPVWKIMGADDLTTRQFSEQVLTFFRSTDKTNGK